MFRPTPIVVDSDELIVTGTIAERKRRGEGGAGRGEGGGEKKERIY